MAETSYEILCHYYENKPQQFAVLLLQHFNATRKATSFSLNDVLDLRRVGSENSGLLGCYVERYR
jgi:hypothetical protein